VLVRLLDVSISLSRHHIRHRAVLGLCRHKDNRRIVGAFSVFKPGSKEGNPQQAAGTGVTSLDWSRTTYEWGTTFCDNADDAGSDNSSDGADADRKASYEDSIAITATDTLPGTYHARGYVARRNQNEEGVILIRMTVTGSCI